MGSDAIINRNVLIQSMIRERIRMRTLPVIFLFGHLNFRSSIVAIVILSQLRRGRIFRDALLALRGGWSHGVAVSLSGQREGNDCRYREKRLDSVEDQWHAVSQDDTAQVGGILFAEGGILSRRRNLLPVGQIYGNHIHSSSTTPCHPPASTS